MSRFNPFGKDLRDILAADLKMLESVSEGWYVEYKRQIQSAESIGKSISSFANQYGGWLFYGIEADSTGNNLPTSYPGISADDWSRFQDRLSSAVSAHVYPAPFFEFKFLQGPVEQVGLEGERGVVVVCIPRGADAPFVHSSGKIFRRVADQSTPVAETDRALLDQLWRRREKARKQLRDFILNSPELSEGESDWPLLNIFFFSDPFGDRGFRSTLDFDEFQKVSQGVDTLHWDLPLDTVFSTADGFIARQCVGNNSVGFCPMLRHYFDGTTIASLPIRHYEINNPIGRRELLRYEHGQQFMQALSERNMESVRWIDLNILLALYVGMYIKHRNLCERGGIVAPTYTKSRFTSLWRTVPFVDAENYLSVIETSGVPYIQEQDIWSPPVLEPEAFVCIERHELTDMNSSILQAAGAWGLSLCALGLQSLMNQGVMTELLGALYRGIETHRGSVTDVADQT